LTLQHASYQEEKRRLEYDADEDL